MELADGSELSSFSDLERYALKNMNLSGMKLEDVSEVEGLSARKLSVSGMDAIEVVYVPDEIAVTGPTPAVRGLTVLGGDYILAIVMMNLDGGDASTPLAWNNLVSSLKVEPPMSLEMKMALGAGLALALLVLLLFLKRITHERTHRRPSSFATATSAGVSAEGWGNARGGGESTPYPESTPAPVRGQPRVLPSSPKVPVGAVASGAPAAPAGMARTLPKSPPRTAPVANGTAPTPPGAARTLPRSEPRVQPVSASAPAPAETVPPSAPPRVPTGGPSLPPAAPRVPTGGPSLAPTPPRVPTGGPAMPPAGHQENPLDGPPAAEAPPPPPASGGGLRSTRPANGRWAESA